MQMKFHVVLIKIQKCTQIYTDFSRAYDSVCHDLLIAKRQLQYNMQGAALNWFRSYLSNRQ